MKRIRDAGDAGMVNLGADVCLGFPSSAAWSGTKDCMTRAAKAGIRVVDCTRPIEVLA